LFGAETPLDSGSKACINLMMLAENPGGPTTWKRILGFGAERLRLACMNGGLCHQRFKAVRSLSSAAV